jgi:hypothetical protein
MWTIQSGAKIVIKRVIGSGNQGPGPHRSWVPLVAQFDLLVCREGMNPFDSRETVPFNINVEQVISTVAQKT